MPFSRSSRQCAGLNLAYAEFYLALAAVFAPGRFRLELFETDVSDVETKHDVLHTSPRLDSEGIRVVVVGMVRLGTDSIMRDRAHWTAYFVLNQSHLSSTMLGRSHFEERYSCSTPCRLTAS